MPGRCVYKDEYERVIDDDFDENEVASNLVKKHLKYLGDWKARWLCLLLHIYPQLSYMCSRAAWDVNRGVI